MRFENKRKRKLPSYYSIRILSAFVFLISLFCITSAQENNDFLLGSIFKLEGLSKTTIQEIQFYENEIRKTDYNIEKSESILKRAREQGNAEAERIAQNAIFIAKEARTRNLSAKSLAETKLSQINLTLISVKNEFIKPISNAEKIASVMTNYTGRISVQTLSGMPFTIDKSRPVFFEKGDVITTFANSNLELQTLSGRGNLKLLENSKIEIGDNSNPEIEFLKLITGKIEVNLEKMEAFERDFEQLIKAYENDLKTIKDEFKAKAVKEFKAKKAAILKFNKKFEVRSCCGAGATRSTRFSVRVDDLGNTEFIVMEGNVELSSPKSEKKVVVKAGEMAFILKDGSISKPKNIGG